MKERTQRRINKIKYVLDHKQPNLTVVLENIHDPHNVSAILRSCDAVGIYEVQLVYNTEPFPKLGKKSSAGTKKWIKINKFTSIAECYSYLRSQNFKIYATSLSEDAISLYDIDFTENIAIVMGNEHSGVSKEAVELADGNYIIPMFGMVQSLNVSVATAVSLYEALRQRLNKGFYNKIQFPSAIYNQILNEWLEK